MRATLGFLLLGILVFTSGCATVDPPAKVSDPARIYLAEYAIHSDLYLPNGSQYVAYTFGDWNYAALDHTWPNDALGALFISFCATLEKRVAEIDPHTGAPILHDHPDMLIRLTADRSQVQKRLAELEQRFQDDLHDFGPSGEIVTENGARLYVKDCDHYSITNDCNDLTAANLRALGFEVNGIVVGSHFHITSVIPTAQAQQARAAVDSP